MQWISQPVSSCSRNLLLCRGRVFGEREKNTKYTKMNLYQACDIHFILHERHEPQHDKTNKMSVRPEKTQISLGIRPVWSDSSLSAWRNLWSLATHWAHSEDTDQTGRMPRLIWVFAGRALILLVLPCRGSHLDFWEFIWRLSHLSPSVNSSSNTHAQPSTGATRSLVRPYFYFHTLLSYCRCAVSPEPSLFAYAKSTIIS